MFELEDGVLVPRTSLKGETGEILEVRLGDPGVLHVLRETIKEEGAEGGVREVFTLLVTVYENEAEEEEGAEEEEDGAEEERAEEEEGHQAVRAIPGSFKLYHWGFKPFQVEGSKVRDFSLTYHLSLHVGSREDRERPYRCARLERRRVHWQGGFVSSIPLTIPYVFLFHRKSLISLPANFHTESPRMLCPDHRPPYA